MALILLGVTLSFPSVLSGQGTMEVGFFDKDTGEPISARIEFTEPINRYPKPKGALIAGRQILVEEKAVFSAPFGKYEFRIRRGPEFNEVRSGFELEPNAAGAFEAYVPRKTPMRRNGWYSGDLLSSLSVEPTRRWMQADDLDVVATTAPLLSQASTKPPRAESAMNDDPSRANNPPALEYVQAGSRLIETTGQGGVVLHRLGTPPEKNVSVWKAIEQSEADDRVHIEITRPWDRDVPLLLAGEAVDSIQVLSEHLLPESGQALTASIRNPDKIRFKGKKGLGRLSEYIYWQMLEAGIQIPPTAGSGFDGKNPTHLGYNRVYVHLDEAEPKDVDGWWRRLKAGYTIVTNGPLMICSINGLPPGSRFPGYKAEPIPLDIELELTVRDPVEYLDVVFNGAPIYQARLEDHARTGQFPDLSIDESGWLVLRVVTEHDDSYRMTTTAPFYFDIDAQPRISRSAVKFFQDWLDESIGLIEKDPKIQSDAETGEAYRVAIERARSFWSNQAERAGTE